MVWFSALKGDPRVDLAVASIQLDCMKAEANSHQES